VSDDETQMQGALFGALAKAQKAAKAVGKDSKNSFHRYAYASAEAIYAECREHLSDHGVTVLPTSSHIDVREGQAMMVRGYLVAHEGGGSLGCVQEWPVVPEKGRPLDKAVASADTTSLAYFLRSLLLLPRVDPSDEMDHDGRDTRGAPAKQAPKPAAAQPDRVSKAGFDTLVILLDDLGLRSAHSQIEELRKIVGRESIIRGSDLTVLEAATAAQILKARLVKAKQDGEAA
jgi:hypothetical protein